MQPQGMDTWETERQLITRANWKQRRARERGIVGRRRGAVAALPFTTETLRTVANGCAMVFVGDMLAYDLFCDFRAFMQGRATTEELTPGEILMEPKKAPRRTWPAWHQAVQHTCGSEKFYFVPDEYIGQMITGGQLREILGREGRVFMVPSHTEILRSLRDGDDQCVAYTNRLLQRTFHLKKLAEDAERTDGAKVSLYCLLSPLVDDCDRGVLDAYDKLLKSEDAVLRVNSAIDELNRLVALGANQYDFPVLDLRLFMSSAFFSCFRSDGHRFLPSHLRYVSQLLIAQYFFLTGRNHPIFRDQKEAWNTWALATWKLETLQASKRLYGMNVTSFHADFTDLDFALLGFHLIPPTKLHQRINALLGGGAPGGPSATVYAADVFGEPVKPALTDLRNLF